MSTQPRMSRNHSWEAASTSVIVVSHNARFDMAFINAELVRAGLTAVTRERATWTRWHLARAIENRQRIDTALRPNGSSGLLVTTADAYDSYQVGRGSNTAWTWEHQAITRARFCAGDLSFAVCADSGSCATASIATPPPTSCSP